MFGRLLTGFPAIFYHIVYAGLFAAIGYTLWTKKRTAVIITLAGTVMYTVEKLLLVTSRATMDIYLSRLTAYSPNLEMIADPQLLRQAYAMMNIMFIMGWWGFMVYIYMQKEYFE